MEDRERDLPWQKSGEGIFLSLSVSTSTPFHLSHTDILSIFHRGQSVQHTFCTAQLSVTGRSVLAVFVEMLFSLFLFSCVGIWNQEQTLHICLADRRWCVNRRSEGSHPCRAFQSLSRPTYRCLLKRCFSLTVAYWIMWLRHLNSWLDLFCLGPWGWEGLVFWPLMCLKKAGYLYPCFFALILWLLLWGTFWCAELIFVHLLHEMSFWFIFVLGTDHPSCSLLCTLSWKQVIADQFIWKTCACCTENSVF